MPVLDRRVDFFSSVLKGLVFSFTILVIISIVLGFIFSIVNNVDEAVINRILLIVNYGAIFSGGMYAVKNIKQNGWLTGGLVGLLYMLVILVLGAQWVDISFSLELFLRILSGFITGAIGGIIGVNL